MHNLVPTTTVGYDIGDTFLRKVPFGNIKYNVLLVEYWQLLMVRTV